MALTPVRRRALDRARRYIGVAEEPPGSNSGPRTGPFKGKIDEWLTKAAAQPGEPWCAAFAYSMLLLVDVKLPIQYPASVGSWIDWANEHGATVARPLYGDHVAYSWNGRTNHPNDHIGQVEKVLALPWPRNGHRFLIRTVEGNADDRVKRCWRWVDPLTVKFIRVRLEGEP